MNASESTPEFEALLQYLQRTRSFDFTDYKRASLMRRVNKRVDRLLSRWTRAIAAAKPSGAGSRPARGGVLQANDAASF